MPSLAGGGGDRLLSVGTIRRPHGVRGEVQVAVETDRPGAVFRPGRTLRLGDASGRPVGRSVTIAGARPVKDGVLVRLEGHESRDAVEGLRGHTLLIEPSEAAPSAADEVPYHLLVGSTAVIGGDPIGTVREIVEAGGGEMLVIRTARGREVLVPFVREMVPEFDRERREVVIVPPDGLLEL